MDINLIYSNCNNLYYNRNLWKDPYDSEIYTNKYFRKFMKILLYFTSDELYTLKLMNRHIWPENLELLGRCFLLLNDIEKAEQIYYELLDLSKNEYYWGLPIEWKSNEYVFPPGIMMSTTTAEIALFFIDLNKKSKVVDKEILEKIAYNLLYGLNRVYEDNDKLILGYTKYDKYKVNNSNLLVAAAIYSIGKLNNDNYLVKSALKITNACVEGISDNGGIPYIMNRDDGYDSYHQVFSLRAFRILKEASKIYEETYNKALNFLEKNLMDELGNVYLDINKNSIDMQGSSEALAFYAQINDYDMSSKIYNKIKQELINSKGNFIQRRWKIRNTFNIKAKNLFTRQGELRLYLSLIIYSMLCKESEEVCGK